MKTIGRIILLIPASIFFAIGFIFKATIIGFEAGMEAAEKLSERSLS